MNLKRIYIDTETTGTTWTSGIHQLALLMEVNGVVEHRRIWKIKPSIQCSFSEEALAVSGVTMDDLNTYQPEAQFLREFNSFLNSQIDKYNKTDKAFFCAYNAQFDAERLRDLYKRQGDNYFGSWFWTPVDCVMIRAGRYMQQIRSTLPDFKLGTVCRVMEIDFDNTAAHDALYDIEKTRELSLKLP